MAKIIQDYEINEETIALIPAKSIEYDTIVLEENAKYYVKQTPINIINKGCLEGGSDYKGRRRAVTHLTGTVNKVPIPINPHLNLYAFPTHSPKHRECSWLFYHHIRKLTPESPHETTVTFTNDDSIQMNVSYSILEKQIYRTSYCVIRFSNQPMPLVDQ
ncbi:competence protein ComK [Bacillus shivajii]|uniref:competence protein ComK n=1 Tax=Bacillus shivajii TaxID=1983719 RepID=UPI001CFA66DA|nr:competence protein ComK [Bacillus shivajii]UCZ52936.1 competence protein ComK [Bacillus shivajii]